LPQAGEGFQRKTRSRRLPLLPFSRSAGEGGAKRRMRAALALLQSALTPAPLPQAERGSRRPPSSGPAIHHPTLVANVKNCQYASPGAPPRSGTLSLFSVTASMTEHRSALIVDDEHDIRELLVLTLGRMGLRTDTAPNLTAARQMLGTVSYDL